MKHLVLSLLITIFCNLSFAQQTESDINSLLIKDKWYAQKSYINDGIEEETLSEEESKGTWVLFKNDGTHINQEYGQDEILEGTWSLNKDQLTITDQGYTFVSTITEISDNRLVLKIEEDGDMMFIVLGR